MALIKFCGIRRQEDVDYVNEVKPNYVGFVFWPESKRYVTPEEAVALADRVSEDISTVGVFLDAPLEEVIEIAMTGSIDYIQLHGNESERYIRLLKGYTGLPVIKAFTVKTRDDVEKAMETMADYVMLDSGAGTGETFDWSILEDPGRPYFLAGGLNTENIAEAVLKLHPFAVDTSSGIETDGVKDLEKMRAFKEIVRKNENIF